MKVGYLTDPGREKELNEDSLYVDGRLGLFILADGMGGHNAGEVASRTAVTCLSAFLEEGLASVDDAARLVREAVVRANEIIFQKSLNNSAWSEMGTTLLLALFRQEQLIVAHVGDSRAYLIKSGKIQQLTQDHTFVAEWLRQGLISEEHARTHEQRHGLTAALGVTDEVEVEVAVWPWDESGCVLLCSDGLTGMMDDEEILSKVQSSPDPQQACQNLVDTANQKGGKDNITVILVCPD